MSPSRAPVLSFVHYFQAPGLRSEFNICRAKRQEETLQANASQIGMYTKKKRFLLVSLRLMVVSLYTINQITFYIEKHITTCGELVVKLMFV